MSDTGSAELAVARQEIEYLRRWYARATDLIGRNTPEAIEEGRGIYRRIFTPDVSIAATDRGAVLFSATGPDGQGQGGEASMTSYLQAWHDAPGELLDIFIGTYHDKVRYTPGLGWQIFAMELEKVAGEVTQR